MHNDIDIQIGDVALDLAQGRPVHVVGDTGKTAVEWSEANDYDLKSNYGNARLGTAPHDPVFDVVYRRSRPSASGLDPEGEGRKPR